MRLSLTTQKTFLSVFAEWALVLSCRMMALSATYGHFSITAHMTCHTVHSQLDHLEVMTHKYTLDVIGQNNRQLRG